MWFSLKVIFLIHTHSQEKFHKSREKSVSTIFTVTMNIFSSRQLAWKNRKTKSNRKLWSLGLFVLNDWTTFHLLPTRSLIACFRSSQPLMTARRAANSTMNVFKALQLGIIIYVNSVRAPKLHHSWKEPVKLMAIKKCSFYCAITFVPYFLARRSKFRCRRRVAEIDRLNNRRSRVYCLRGFIL